MYLKALASILFRSAAGDRSDDEKRLVSTRDRVGQRGIRRLVRQVLLAGEEPQERAALPGRMVADRPSQHRVAGLERIQDRALGHRTLDLELDVSVDAGQRPQMRRQRDADHGRVWTSTDRTAGRSRTIAVHESPASADA